MKILIVSQYYWPEDFAAGVYIRELAEALVVRGHEVTVLTAFPHYPEGRVWPAYRGRTYLREEKGGVQIVRTYIFAVPRDRPLRVRVLTHLSFALSASLVLPWLEAHDVCYVHMPVLPLGFVSVAACSIRGTPCVLGVKDLSAEALVQSGKVSRGGVSHLVEKLEHLLYSLADQIQVPGLDYKRRLESWGIREDAISVVPDWADADFVRPMPKENEFRRSHQLDGKFVVLYSGNMGFSSDLGTVLQAAREVGGDEGIRFVLIGDGVMRQSLLRKAADLRLENVTFLPFQARTLFPEALAAADVCLVTLNRKFTGVAAQGKMYNIMAAGRPVLAVMDEEACGADMIRRENMGRIVQPGDAEGLARIIADWRMRPEECDACGRRARLVLESRFTVERCTEMFEEVFKAATRSYASDGRGV